MQGFLQKLLVGGESGGKLSLVGVSRVRGRGGKIRQVIVS